VIVFHFAVFTVLVATLVFTFHLVSATGEAKVAWYGQTVKLQALGPAGKWTFLSVFTEFHFRLKYKY